MIGNRDAEVSVRERAYVLPVLDIDRLVEAVQVPRLRNPSRRRALAEQCVRRTSRQRVHPEEDQDRDAEQNRDEHQEPADEIPKHQGVRMVVLPDSAVTRSKPGKDARSIRACSTDATENAAWRRLSWARDRRTRLFELRVRRTLTVLTGRPRRRPARKSPFRSGSGRSP